jgi:hypothetical protein
MRFLGFGCRAYVDSYVAGPPPVCSWLVRISPHDCPVATAEEIRWKLRYDRGFYAEHCLKVVDEDGEIVPLKPRPAQTKVYAALERQRKANLPQRVIVLKSRKVGISTASTGAIVQDTTQEPNCRSLIVAQDHTTAGELFDIADLMYVELPDDPEIKPGLSRRATSRGGAKELHFGEAARDEQLRGNRGINSRLSIDTAREVAAGRGKTIRKLLCTEVGFWPDERKTLSLMNAVPERPGTLIIFESTANGHNFFKRRWDTAMRGQGGFIPVFIGWTEDENCQRPFVDPDERLLFIESIGTGPWGEDEPRLVEQYDCTPEQLNWRRHTIEDKTEGKLELFDQEYPSDAARAFVGSGKHVFSIVFVQQAIDRAEEIEQREPKDGGPQRGIIKETTTKQRQVKGDTIEIPTAAMWVPSEATGFPLSFDFWTRWEIPPEADVTPPPGQYIVSVDPAGGEENTSGEEAFHGIQVIDHRTLEQVAELETRRLDPDELAKAALLAALLFNDATITVETTGGYGMPVVRKLWDVYGWRRIYKRKAVERSGDKTTDRLGFDTNRSTKPMMIAGLTELLREGTHGIRSKRLALQLTTYILDNKGRARPDDEAFADLLTAYMQGQEVARQTRLRPDGSSQGPVNTWTGGNY